jgi:hypothetical protein
LLYGEWFPIGSAIWVGEVVGWHLDGLPKTVEEDNAYEDDS